ncbi:hypothetical protein [Pseudomonas sp. PLMAX]|uniref:hypothetical protein n=1 Tax=Pseudomonas sp. PLMAX TaxID=2201998 RepID=UPI0038BDE870
MVKSVEQAKEQVKEAQRVLIAAVRWAYPEGTKVLVKRGESKLRIKVTGHHSQTGENAGVINGVDMDSGKSRTFHDSNVIELLPE